LVGKPEEKRTYGKPIRRWKNDIKAIFRKWDVRALTGISWLRM
jgi:hypothetical protein